MMTRYLISGLLLFFGLFLIGMSMRSCGNQTAGHHVSHHDTSSLHNEADSLSAHKDSLAIESEYDLETVDPKDRKEFLENMAKIEKQYGEQWDFCTCIIKNDSVQKAFMNEALSDAEFDVIVARSEEIDNKCQAFLVQSRNQTPEERYEHKKKVDKCLKEAGLK
ncbi:MAG: hypothetical protein NXI10_12015 [bacterium]|nr:hypothetical protein [bacterium]